MRYLRYAYFVSVEVLIGETVVETSLGTVVVTSSVVDLVGSVVVAVTMILVDHSMSVSILKKD